MWFVFLLICLAHECGGFILGGSSSGRDLKVASFNIQVFGSTKYSKPDVAHRIVQIISRYDVIVVLEIRDSSETVFGHLLQDLNAYVKSSGHSYSYAKIESSRLGRTNSKEQYGFLYNTAMVSSAGTYQYPDPHDVFEREPFGVKFHSPHTAVSDFVMVANHIQPDKAMEEMDNLTAAYDTFARHFHTNNVILAGDFNADCRYLSNRDWQHVSLRQEHRFHWLIDDSTDTTVGTTTCSYDRFVVGSSTMYNAIVPGSAKVYRFDDVMGLSKPDGLAVSDHYPVELQIRSR